MSGVELALAAVLSTAGPFGLAGAGSGLRPADAVAQARALGLTTVEWDVDLARPGTDPDLELLAASGLRIVLTIDPGGQAPNMVAAAAEEAIRTFRPVLLVVGGPEQPSRFRDEGTDPYLATVKAACAAARQRSVPCTTGGLPSREVLLLAWNHHRGAGRTDVARALLARGLPAEAERLSSPHPGEGVEESLARGSALLAGYAPAGVDYVNLRWSLADPAAFRAVADFLRRATGLPLVSTALGGSESDAAGVAALLAEVRRQEIAVALWPAGDLGTTTPTETPRNGGEAFRVFIQSSRPR